MDLDGGLNGPARVVFVGLRDSEKGQHPVTHQSINEALVIGNDLFDPGEDVSGYFLDLLGVKLLGQGRVTGEIREQDGNVLALSFRSVVRFGSSSVCLKVMPTLQAEICPLRKVGSTLGTNQNNPSSKKPRLSVEKRGFQKSLICVPPKSVVAKLEEGYSIVMNLE